MEDKIILTGILQYASNYPLNGRIYSEDVYKAQMDTYLNQLKYEKRKRIIDKLLKNNPTE